MPERSRDTPAELNRLREVISSPFLRLLDHLSSPLFEKLGAAALRRGLLRYYLGRLSNAEDRALVIQLLDAHGLGPNTWKFSG